MRPTSCAPALLRSSFRTIRRNLENTVTITSCSPKRQSRQLPLPLSSFRLPARHSSSTTTPGPTTKKETTTSTSSPYTQLNLRLFRRACAERNVPVAVDAYRALKNTRSLYALTREDFVALVRVLSPQPQTNTNSKSHSTPPEIKKRHTIFLQTIFMDMFAIPDEDLVIRGHIPQDVYLVFLDAFHQTNSRHRVNQLWEHAVAADAATWNDPEVAKTGRPPRQAFVLDLSFYNRVLAVAAEEDVGLAKRTFAHLQSNPRVEPDHESWRLFITAHCSVRDSTGALDVFNQFLKSTPTPEEIAPDAEQKKNSVDAVASGEPDTNTAVPTLALYNQLLAAFCKAGDIEGAHAVLKQMTLPVNKGGGGHLPNIFTYNILLNAEVSRGNVDGALRIVDTMKRDAIRRSYVAPSIVTYNTLLNMYAKLGNTKAAEDVLSTMQLLAMEGHGNSPETSVAPDQISYNSLMDAYRKVNDRAGVEKAFQRMLKAEILPNESTYNILIAAVGFSGDPAKARLYFNEMVTGVPLRRQPPIPPTRTTFGELASIHGVMQDLDGADAWYDMMTGKYDISPNVKLINGLMSFHHKAGSWDGVLRYYEEGLRYSVYGGRGGGPAESRKAVERANALLAAHVGIFGDVEKAVKDVYIPYFAAAGVLRSKGDSPDKKGVRPKVVRRRIVPNLDTLRILRCPGTKEEAVRGIWSTVLKDDPSLMDALHLLKEPKEE